MARLFFASYALFILSLSSSTQVTARKPERSYIFSHGKVPGNGTGPDHHGKYRIEAPGIRAYFIPYGATITNMFINDTYGIYRDVVVGYDKISDYWAGDNKHFGGVTGRYTNRIMNSTFIMDGTNYTVIPNDNNKNDTIFGGPNGWDQRNWTLVAHTTDSISFSLYDHSGSGGFPGAVIAHVTYTVTDYPRPRWYVRMTAVSLTKTTPIMLGSRAQWNLDGFQDLETPTVFNQTLYLPYSGTQIETDSIRVPTGNIIPNTLYDVNDFWSHYKYIGHNFSSSHMEDNCGANCTGYDNTYLINRDAASQLRWWLDKDPVAEVRSYFTEIRMNVYTDQAAVQVSSCNHMDGTLPLKESQGLFHNNTRPRFVQKHGCLSLEFQDWPDAINHPEWGRQPKQAYGPGDSPFILQAAYEFAVSTQTPTCSSSVATATPTPKSRKGGGN